MGLCTRSISNSNKAISYSLKNYKEVFHADWAP